MDCDGSVAEVFLMESKDLLSKMENVLLKMEQGEQNPDFVNSIFRSAHTLKGAAAMFDFKDLSSFAHEIENLLSACRNKNISINNKQISGLLEAIDCLSALLEESVKKSIKPETIAHKMQIIEKIKQAESDMVFFAMSTTKPDNNIATVVTSETLKETASNTTTTAIQENKKQDEITINLEVQEHALQPSANQIDVHLEQNAKKIKEMSNVILNASNEMHQYNKVINDEKISEFVRTIIKVEANKLDEIINLIGEIVIMQAHLSNLTKENKIANNYFVDSMERLSNLIDDLRNLSLKLRMLPINETFSKFNRVVRDIASQKNKQIKLQIKGGDTELDKSIIEKINEPLLHLIRNACDHGIDPPDVRVALDKPACGEITLEALQENGEVIIKVCDDGQGINLAKVKQHAIEMKLLDPSVEHTEQEIIACIFQPGFSTAEEVTTVSGRGVGMDIVKKEVEKLHGSIQIYTELKVGTTIALRLPLTLAIINGLLIKVHDFLCVIPMWNVIECIQIAQEEYETILRNNNMQFRNTILPGIILNNLLEIPSNTELHSAIIVQQANYKVAIVVDALVGEIQTVIKPMPEIFAKLKWINGATVLGDGQIAVILDITGLISEVINKHKQTLKITT